MRPFLPSTDTYQLDTSERGWFLEVHGFSQKLANVLCRICAALHALATTPCDETILSRVVSAYELRLRNACFAANDLAIDERLRCLEVGWLTAADKLGAMPRVTPEAVSAHVADSMASGVHLCTYVGGNLDAAEARTVLDQAHAALGKPPPLAALPRLRNCAQIPAGRAERAVVGNNPADENCAVDLYWQFGADEPTLGAKANLLQHLMYEPLFDSLRTKQQLGYSVSCSARNTQGALGFLISVVSQTHTPEDIEQRVLSFVSGYVDTLKSMPKAEYASNVNAAVANGLLADKTIDEEASRYWQELDMRTYAFTKAEDEAAAMRATTQAQLATFAKRMFLSDAARKLSVIVRPVEGAAKGEAGKAKGGSIDDPGAFATSMPPHPRNQGKLPTVTK